MLQKQFMQKKYFDFFYLSHQTTPLKTNMKGMRNFYVRIFMANECFI